MTFSTWSRCRRSGRSASRPASRARRIRRSASRVPGRCRCRTRIGRNSRARRQGVEPALRVDGVDALLHIRVGCCLGHVQQTTCTQILVMARFGTTGRHSDTSGALYGSSVAGVRTRARRPVSAIAGKAGPSSSTPQARVCNARSSGRIQPRSATTRSPASRSGNRDGGAATSSRFSISSHQPPSASTWRVAIEFELRMMVERDQRRRHRRAVVRPICNPSAKRGNHGRYPASGPRGLAPPGHGHVARRSRYRLPIRKERRR